MLAARGVEALLGETGILALAALSGIADVDAITLTLSRFGSAGATLETATFGIVLAAAVNSGVKAVLAFAVGNRRLGWHAGVPLVVAASVGLALAALRFVGVLPGAGI
jgi:uncharacterized membrane protein (DUF4010 family)